MKRGVARGVSQSKEEEGEEEEKKTIMAVFRDHNREWSSEAFVCKSPDRIVSWEVNGASP